MRRVVGLGNPARVLRDPAQHRLRVVDHLAAGLGFVGSPSDFGRQARTKFDGWRWTERPPPGGGSEKLLLPQPATYINLSGRSVRRRWRFTSWGRRT